MNMFARLVVLSACAVGIVLTSQAGEDAYPLTTCVVSGETLGSHGKTFVEHYEGREVRLCCKGCRKDFLKEPAKYIKMLDTAAAQAATASTNAPAAVGHDHAGHTHNEENE